MLGTSPYSVNRYPATMGAGVVETLAMRLMMLKPIPLFSLGSESATIALSAGW